MVTTIETLWKKHKNKTLIAKLTGHDWKTVDKVIKSLETGASYPTKKSHPRIIDPFKEQVVQMVEKGLSAVRIHEELQSIGLKVGYTAVRDYIKLIKGKEIFMRMHTDPGEEAQVDFGYAGLTKDNHGKNRRTWVFNMRLSYSRLDYYEKVYDQRVETFINCHTSAFKYFKGVPRYIKIDNLKAAILNASFYEPVYQQLYKSFASHCGFSPIPCRVRKPNDKGKVESGIAYVKGNFFAGRTFENENELNKNLRNWLDNKCNIRIHGTIKKVPRQVFEEIEKQKLLVLPLADFETGIVGSRKVYHDCHIYVDNNYYSVPFEYVGKEVEISVKSGVLRVVYENKTVATHPRLTQRGDFSTKLEHYPKYKRYSDTEYQEKYQVKMADIGPFAQQLFFKIIENSPRDWSRAVKGVLSLAKQYPNELVELSCKRAFAFNVCSYQIIKNILVTGSYNLPLEFNQEETEYEYA